MKLVRVGRNVLLIIALLWLLNFLVNSGRLGETPVVSIAHAQTDVPSARYAASMTFDSRRNKVVLFGGCLGDCRNNANLSNETWEFDGTTWEKIATLHSPSPRQHAGMVYDTQREVIVLFGGYALNDTWEYNGTDWTQITTQNSPSARIAVDLAYDSGRQVVILSSGHQPNYCNVGTNFTDVWEYDGTNWTARINSGGPLNELPNIAYDPIRQRTIHFVGRHNCNLLSQTWAYDGTNIFQLSPTTIPPPTAGGRIIFDPILAKIALFGGCTGSNSSRCTLYSNDIWTFDDTTWNLLNLTNKPPGRYFHTMVYDTTRQRLIVFGGCANYYWGLICYQPLNDLWEFDGAQWIKIFPNYSISGQVRDSNNNPISGVRISTTGGVSATTNATGAYTITQLNNGTYTLTPSKSGYVFSPPSLTVSVPPDATNQNFVGAPIETGDPLFPQQWGLHKVEIAGAWAQSQGSSSVTIAVIDTGVDYAHVDLGGGKTLTHNDYDYVHNDDDAMDDQGHGTHVAGIAAANTNNGQGIAGVCPQCRILPFKVLNSAGTGDFAAVAGAIREAADQGAKVINMSLGGDSCTTDLASAINYAYDKKVTIVAAAGNSCPVKVAFGLETFDVSYPAQFDRVIAVGATNSADGRADFSNYGPTLDITAPGVGILSTYLEGSYQRLDGTSMASPMVAGLAGLILSKNPSLSPAQVQKIIETSADNLDNAGWDAQTGWGRINANRALQTTAGNINPASPAVCLNPANVKVTASTREENLVALYQQLRDKVLLPSEVGTHYVNLFYEYGPELAGILLTNPALRDRTAQFLDHASEEFESLLQPTTEITLTQGLYNEADTLVQDLAAAGSTELRSKMAQTWEELALDEHIGEKTTDIWKEMNSKAIYLPLLIK